MTESMDTYRELVTRLKVNLTPNSPIYVKAVVELYDALVFVQAQNTMLLNVVTEQSKQCEKLSAALDKISDYVLTKGRVGTAEALSQIAKKLRELGNHETEVRA